MTSEFFALPTIEPALSDQLILVRGRRGQAATVQGLKALLLSGDAEEPTDASFIAFSATPPEDKKLWFQLDGNGFPVELWRLHPSGLWLSEQVAIVDVFEYAVKRDLTWSRPTPFPGEALWMEALAVSAWVQDDMRSGDYIDFQIARVDTQQRQTAFFQIRMANQRRGSTFQQSESVGVRIEAAESMALFLRLRRRGQTKLRTCSLRATVRRVYGAD
ncbi:MAG: hypothetical protein AB8B99_03005 [Phormidesmis sp.]